MHCTLKHLLPLAIATTLLLVAGTGCSKENRKARHLEKATAHFQAGEWDRAELEYKNALKLERLNPDAMAGLAIIYFDQGRIGGVPPLLAKARELQPDNLELRLRMGRLHVLSNKFTEAREEARFVLQKRPGDAEAPLVLADTAQQPTEIADLRAELQSLPTAGSAPVLTALGSLAAREGKIPEAEALFEKAIVADGRFALAHAALGTLKLAQKDEARALELMAKAAAVAPARSTLRLRSVQLQAQTGKIEAARQELQAMTQATPDFLSAWLLLAEFAARENKPDDCLAALQKVLALDAYHLEAMLLEARTRFAKGEKERALSTLERAAKAYPGAANVHLQLGGYHAANGDITQAVASLTQALAASPGWAPAVLALAEINLRQGNPAAAVASLRDLVQKQPQLAQGRLLLATALRAQRSLDAALDVYRRLDADFPGSAQTPLMMGMVLLEQQKRAEARAAFSESLKRDPAFLPALESLINLDLLEKQPAAARARLDTHLAKSPNRAELHLLAGKIAFAENDLTQAEASLRKSIEIQPDSVIGYMLLARLFLSSKDPAKALESLETAIAKNPKNTEALMIAAIVQQEQKNHAAARDHYEKLLAANPRMGPALNNLAYLYSEQFNDQEKAQELAQRARDVMPHDPHVADTFGWILYKRGNYPRALALLSESADRLGTSAEVQFHLGMTHYMLADEKAAAAALERALGLAADFPGVAEARRALELLRTDINAAPAEIRSKAAAALAKGPDPIAQIRLGGVEERAGNTAKALTAYEEALKLSPGSVRAALGVIRISVAQKNTAKAMEVARATRKLAPEDPELGHALGRLAFDSGDHGWALSLLQESTRRDPENPELLFDLAEAAYSRGQVSLAQESLERALKLNAQFSRAAQAREFREAIGWSTNA